MFNRWSYLGVWLINILYMNPATNTIPGNEKHSCKNARKMPDCQWSITIMESEQIFNGNYFEELAVSLSLPLFPSHQVQLGTYLSTGRFDNHFSITLEYFNRLLLWLTVRGCQMTDSIFLQVYTPRCPRYPWNSSLLKHASAFC